VSDFSAEWLAARHELVERLDGITDSATDSATVAVRTVAGMAEEHAAATAALGAQVADLRGEVSIARHSVAELRRALARVAQRASGGDVTGSPEDLLPGLGVASGFENDRRAPASPEPETRTSTAKTDGTAKARKANKAKKAAPRSATKAIPAKKVASRRSTKVAKVAKAARAARAGKVPAKKVASRKRP
jgi:hypothetical protein